MPVRRTALSATIAAAVLALVGTAVQPGAMASPTESSAPTDYLVLFKGTSPDAAATKAIDQAKGTITEVNTKLGYAYVRTTNARFAQSVAASGAVTGAARERVIGRDPQLAQPKNDVEKVSGEKVAGSKVTYSKGKKGKNHPAPEPLADLQWDMKQIGATATQSYAKSQGKKGVRVGIIDTGIDGTHPDIAPNFSRALSRNFVTDMPDIDGACEYASCIDPVDEDDDGHGTHVASTIGSPINGLGIAGVAPKVTLINIRAGQDSGYFFLKPTLEALTYAGDIGVDVVNMSYYVDPWLYNCLDNPADTPAQQAEQRVVRQATQRALNYAMNRGVLPVAAMGNGATDLGHPVTDDTSPDYPVEAPYERDIDNSCITVPTESRGVVGVSSTGISKRKAYYSDYGIEQTDIAAPGGDTYDTPDNKRDVTKAILAAYPKNVAVAAGQLNADGTPNTAAVVRDCQDGVCAYYQYIQGTSMASPHAAGVAALVVSEHGKRDWANGGLRLGVDQSRAWLYRSAQPTACPTPRTYHYTRILPAGNTVEADATCEGPRAKNGFYGRGIVSANAAVRGR